MRIGGKRGKVYEVLRRAALSDLPCPTNAEIAEEVGYSTASSASSAIDDLKHAALISVEHYGQARDVLFPDGLRTNCRRDWDAVRAATAEAFGLDPWMLVNSARRRDVVRARMVCTWVLRTKFPDLTLPAIGRLLGGRDHSSIIYYLDRAAYYREVDPTFRAISDALSRGESVSRVVTFASPRSGKAAMEEEPVAAWCSQCEARVMPERTARCRSPWCGLKVAA